MNKQPKIVIKETKNFVDKKELNLWKSGFTPQAEIWNGRMATVGIGIIFIIIALISNFLNRNKINFLKSSFERFNTNYSCSAD